jgi:putative PIN family toxin of toxin-antitoxin system
VGHPAEIYRAWQEGYFTLLVCAELLEELKATLHKPALAARIKPFTAGRMLNELKDLTEVIGTLPHVERSPDSSDNFLLALSEAGNADYLVTGDKSGLLSLARHEGTRIISASAFATLTSRRY